MIENKPRIVWADLLRLIAIFMVICSHSADPFNVSPEARANPRIQLLGQYLWRFYAPMRSTICYADGHASFAYQRRDGPLLS